MTPERFTTLLGAYGARLDRWPTDQREDARAFAAAHPGAADAMERASRLDAALACWTVPGPGAALAGRVAMIGVARHAGLHRLRLWRSSMAAAALATGFAAGAAAVAVSAALPQWDASPLYGVSVLGAPLDLGADTTSRGPA